MRFSLSLSSFICLTDRDRECSVYRVSLSIRLPAISMPITLSYEDLRVVAQFSYRGDTFFSDLCMYRMIKVYILLFDDLIVRYNYYQIDLACFCDVKAM